MPKSHVGTIQPRVQNTGIGQAYRVGCKGSGFHVAARFCFYFGEMTMNDAPDIVGQRLPRHVPRNRAQDSPGWSFLGDLIRKLPALVERKLADIELWESQISNNASVHREKECRTIMLRAATGSVQQSP